MSRPDESQPEREHGAQGDREPQLDAEVIKDLDAPRDEVADVRGGYAIRPIETVNQTSCIGDCGARH